ncbi:hypothetical protein G9A89_017359 [Geosiphon pyriformis]|nr:hypothetical protein G9A89_017359 [Geosiphon pyriformis]
MVSPDLKLARWTALGVGIFYGWFHSRSLVHAEAKRKALEKYHRKEELIAKAKAAYAAKLAAENTSGVITDPNDPRFSLEGLLKSLE